MRSSPHSSRDTATFCTRGWAIMIICGQTHACSAAHLLLQLARHLANVTGDWEARTGPTDPTDATGMGESDCCIPGPKSYATAVLGGERNGGKVMRTRSRRSKTTLPCHRPRDDRVEALKLLIMRMQLASNELKFLVRTARYCAAGSHFTCVIYLNNILHA